MYGVMEQLASEPAAGCRPPAALGWAYVGLRGGEEGAPIGRFYVEPLLPL